ncbi:MAG TPA: AraC family transcriptional regulator [Fimbriimonadaceae bacterium]|nr:AraC family transcriptional regulator [Fimbriimonadaceae bacterium]
MPFSLEIAVPEAAGRLVKLHLVGVFALFADRQSEAPGTLGASLLLGDERDPLLRMELVNGRHYSDAVSVLEVDREIGDGASVRSVGLSRVDGAEARVDVLTIDVPDGPRPTKLVFRDLGTPASFLLFDAVFEFEPVQACPFSTRSKGVALSDLGAIVRLGDRVRLQRAIGQLEGGLIEAEDLDEARGQALTFIALVTAATIEMGGGREMHRVQLDAARELERLTSVAEFAAAARRIVEEVAAPLVEPLASPSGQLIDRSLAFLSRNFAKDISDSDLAGELGLSTSHFRFLFKEATGQPFHRYLIALRLERAKKLLVETEMPISEVAAAVGFSGLAHFSRAFAQRFDVSPSNLRRGAAASRLEN